MLEVKINKDYIFYDNVFQDGITIPCLFNLYNLYYNLKTKQIFYSLGASPFADGLPVKNIIPETTCHILILDNGGII